ncbi:hypothetical protein JHK84_048289 [Glycine max]|nr:hypothetical protein JHK85_048891 [Glycine max]KAG5103320.1 hypothetical protein JHK84_048289 [Glycine max]
MRWLTTTPTSCPRTSGTPPWCRRSTPRSTLYIVRRFDNPRYYKYFVIKSCHVILGNSDVRPFHEIHVFSGLLAAISTECLDDECHIIGLSMIGGDHPSPTTASSPPSTPAPPLAPSSSTSPPATPPRTCTSGRNLHDRRRETGRGLQSVSKA